MEISSCYVGRRCRALDIYLAPRQCMNFAAGLEDNNAFYFDDTRPESMFAPPMMAVALTWPISSCLENAWDEHDFPLEVLKQQVHYSETLEWHRPMRPGDHVHVEGVVAAMTPHRAGTHMVMKYRATDPSGSLFFVEYIGAMLRDVYCTDNGAGAENLPLIPRFRSNAQPIWESRLHIDPLAAHVYDGCCDLHFPIHTSPAFAQAVGLPGTIYQGTATLGLALREILNREGGADPRRLKRCCCLFTGMVRPDTDIRIQVMAREVKDGATDFAFVVLNAEGRPAIRSGGATLSA